MKIYHNPRCSTSRKTLQLIEKQGIEPEISLYLQQVPGKEELKDILKKLGMKAEELVRKKETLFKEKFKGQHYTEEEWIKILVENPKLIERPIVVKGDKAVLGRPPENVKTLF